MKIVKYPSVEGQKTECDLAIDSQIAFKSADTKSV